MPSKTKKQAKFMAAVANNPKFAKKAGVPQSVGQEFANADKRNKDMPSYFDSTKKKPGKAVKKYNRGGMAHDKRVLRNLDDEDYRIRNRTGSNTDAERRRINREKDFEKNRMGGMAAGGKVKKQGYNDRLDESLGARNGKKSQSLKSRRDESKGMEKAKGKGAYSGASTMMSDGGKVSGKTTRRRGDGPIMQRGFTRGGMV